MKQIGLLLGSVAMTALVLAGCATASGKGCAPKGKEVTICLNGRPIDFSAEKNLPHRHDSNNLYAPVMPMARALGVNVQADPATKVVFINGKRFVPAGGKQTMGIHVHNGVVFVPVKDFAAAAGLPVQMDLEKGTAAFQK